MSTLAARALNRALERETWARERLAVHAGRTFSVSVGPAVQTFRILASGELESTTGTSDLSLRMSPFRLPSLLAEPHRWSEWVSSTGDTALAATLADLAQALPWLIEAMLGRALGPIVGARAADLGRRALALPQHAAERIGASVSSYAQDEAAMRFGVTRKEAAEFGESVSAVAARMTSLEARIEQLARSGRLAP